MGWIYFGTLRVIDNSTATAVSKAEYGMNLLSLYSFADKLCLPKLMDLVLDTHKNSYGEANRFLKVSLVSNT